MAVLINFIPWLTYWIFLSFGQVYLAVWLALIAAPLAGILQLLKTPPPAVWPAAACLALLFFGSALFRDQFMDRRFSESFSSLSIFQLERSVPGPVQVSSRLVWSSVVQRSGTRPIIATLSQRLPK